MKHPTPIATVWLNVVKKKPVLPELQKFIEQYRTCLQDGTCTLLTGPGLISRLLSELGPLHYQERPKGALGVDLVISIYEPPDAATNPSVPVRLVVKADCDRFVEECEKQERSRRGRATA